MADPLVIHSDLTLFLTSWYKPWLDERPEPFADGVEVGAAEPAKGPFPKRMLVIADDGGPHTSPVTAERVVRFVALAGSRENPKDANDLIGLVVASFVLLPVAGDGDLPGIRNPIAAVGDVNGPYAVEEPHDLARRYVNVTLTITPVALT